MFTNNSWLETWLGPRAETEPILGGREELVWEPNDRKNNSTIGCRVTDREPDQFLAFDWRCPKQFKHCANNADPFTHVVVFFIPRHIGTDIHLLHSGWRSSVEWEEARQWQEQAWLIASQELEKQIISKGA